MRKTLFILIVFVLLGLPSFFVFADGPIKILIVPGHDNEVWGSQYGNIKEADMNLRLATELFNLLRKDKRFEVYITRDSLGYTTEFASYFTDQTGIMLFKENAKKEMQANIENGNLIKKEDNVDHNTASASTAMVLYGINKWANENKIDAVIHVHFNDYPRKTKWTKGQYKGFAIYIPDEQMINSKDSTNLAKSIFTQLRKKYTPSTYLKENGGLVHEQSLIALGSNNTLLPSVRSVLIEYGYIYRFGNNDYRHKFYTAMANLTAKGIKSYFFN